MITHSDNLDFMLNLPSACMDLIYLDPPYNTRRKFMTFDDVWNDSLKERLLKVSWETILEDFDGLTLPKTQGYLAMMLPRLVECKRILKPSGSIWLQCDSSASHYLKVLMDNVFGANNFRNEIFWKRMNGKSLMKTSKRLGNTIDSILFYGASKNIVFNPPFQPISQEELERKFPLEDERGRYHTTTPIFCHRTAMPSNTLYYEYKGWTPPHDTGWRLSRKTLERLDSEGAIIWRGDKPPLRKSYAADYAGKSLSNLWLDIKLPPKGENCGFQTQKPLALLERIIKIGTDEGHTVFDPFCGSGTTLLAAKRLNRKGIGVDIEEEAVRIAQERLNL